MKLLGKVAIVTGGGRGIGRATALALAAEGAVAVVAARTQKEIDSVADEIMKAGGKSLAVKTDVRSSDSVRQLVKRTVRKFGRIDILINNAGIALLKQLWKTDEKEFDDIIDTNLKGTYHGCREVVPVMLKQKSGTIVNISSGLGRVGYPGMAPYCASKFGVIGLTEALAMETKGTGLKVYSILPGGTDTKLYRETFHGEDYSRLLRPGYIAEKVRWLCLPETKVKSGSAIEAYGE